MLTAMALALPVEFLVLQIACTYVALRLLRSHLGRMRPLGL
jgi:hypothetical protein